ncbi:MAG: GNAT family N-acetyltransferase [Anaerolineales bacterium]
MDRTSLAAALKADPGWSAYALADLDPAYEAYCQWKISGSAVLLEYSGLEPPVLFASGPASPLEPLVQEIQPGKYQYTLQDQQYPAFQARLSVQVEARMWRMVLDWQNFEPGIPDSVRRLTHQHVKSLQSLYNQHPDRPDAYHPSQLDEPGVFYGVYDGDQLMAAAGTHVVSPMMSVAAIGNIFTHPDWRSRGLCVRVTQAVCSHLVQEDIELIVLNVNAANSQAMHCYEKVGFIPHCQYLEGVGLIT